MVPLVLVCACLAAVALLAFTTGQNILRNYHLRQEEQVIRTELLELERDQQQLEGIRRYLESDEYIEDVARRTLGLVKPGETLVVVSGEAPAPASAPTPAADAPWWKSLFGINDPTPAPPPLVP